MLREEEMGKKYIKLKPWIKNGYGYNHYWFYVDIDMRNCLPKREREMVYNGRTAYNFRTLLDFTFILPMNSHSALTILRGLCSHFELGRDAAWTEKETPIKQKSNNIIAEQMEKLNGSSSGKSLNPLLRVCVLFVCWATQHTNECKFPLCVNFAHEIRFSHTGFNPTCIYSNKNGFNFCERILFVCTSSFTSDRWNLTLLLIA